MIEKITSRKFLLAIIAAVYFVSIGDYNQALIVIMAYLGVNGAVEIFKK